MFEAIRNNKRIAQVILGILIVPFAAFGLDSYFGDRLGNREVATVGGSSIYRGEFERALEEQRESLREQLGAEAAAEVIKSGKLQQEVLNQLILERALALYAKDMRLSVSSVQLQQALSMYEAFHENGQFSLERYKTLLQRQGMTPVAFEAKVAQNLLVDQLKISITGSSLIARDTVRRLLIAEGEERMVREMRFPVQPHLSSIKINDEAIKKFYDDNMKHFELPGRVKAEYLVFSEEALQGKLKIDEEKIKKAYQDLPEDRRVRHILIELASDADEAAVGAARSQAEEIVATLREKPDDFPAIAREKSQDPGSSGEGGDLGNIAHDGTMEQPFEEAVFALEKGDISDPVRTSYGFHILQVTDSQKRSFGEMRDEIEARLRKDAIGKEFNKDAEEFSDMVFSRSQKDLEPVAKAFGLEIQKTDWINEGADTLGEFHNKELVSSLFEDEVLKDKKNTEAIVVGFNTLVSARVFEHEAARRKPLEEVRGQIEAQLRRKEAMRLAREEGTAALEALDRGETVSNAWSAPRSFQRSKPDLPPLVAREVFAELMRLPDRVALELPDDAYVIYQIDEVKYPSIDNDDPRIAERAQAYGFLLGMNDFNSFALSLRDRYKIVTKPLADRAAE